MRCDRDVAAWPRASSFCRSSLNGPIIRPNDSSARPLAVHESRADDGDVGMAARSVGEQRDRSRRAARSCRCSAAGACAPVLARMPDVVRARRSRRSRPARSRGRPASAAAASALPSVEALSTTTISCGVARRRGLRATRGSARGRRCALKLTMMIESSVTVIGRRASMTASVFARGARPVVLRERRRRGAPRSRDARRPRRTARASSARGRRRRSSPTARRAPRRRSVSRATGVSSSTGGTPAASASSGVRPSPSYSDRNANARARRVQLAAAAASATYSMPADAARRPSAAMICAEILARIAAVVADDVERRRRRAPARPAANARIRSGTWRRLKIEPDEQHARGSRAGGRSPADGRRRCRAGSRGCGASGHAEALDDLAPRELRDRSRRPRARCADCRVSQRRRTPSRSRNHSGCATNDRSWIGDDGRDVEAERRRVGRREEHVEAVARRDARGSRDLLPPRAAAIPARRGVANRRGVERDGERLGRVQDELVLPRGVGPRPTRGSRPPRYRPTPVGAAAQFARVYADAHRRCSMRLQRTCSYTPARGRAPS